MESTTVRSYAAIVALTTVCAIALYLAIAGRGSTVSGIGNGGARVNTDSTAARVAKLLVSAQAAPAISDDQLKQVARALIDKATAGDDHAVAVVAEIAALQRKRR